MASPGYAQEPAAPQPKRRKAKIVGRREVVRKYKDGTVREKYQLQKYSNGNSIKHGLYTSWFSDGQVNRKGMYVLSKKSGEWIFYFQNGKVAKKGVYKNSLPDGKWVVNNEDGTPSRVEIYKDGKPHGKWTLYHAAGKEGAEKDGAGKVLREVDYIGGVQHGVVREFFKDGALRFTMEMKNGKKHGQLISFYPTGEKLSEENYKDGKRNGRMIGWDVEGKVLQQAEYVDGSELSSQQQQASSKQAEPIPTPQSDDENLQSPAP